MNDRQQQITKYLLKNNKRFFAAEQLADVFGCSEKTIRTDVESILSELYDNHIKIGIYKTNKGISIDATYQEKQEVLHFLRLIDYAGTNPHQIERDFDLVEKLFMEPRTYTVTELSQALFMSENTLRRKLNEFRNKIREYDLKLTTGKNGICISGSENEKMYFWIQNIFRLNNAVVEERLKKYFSDEDVKNARTVIRLIEKYEGHRYTGAASFQLAYVLVYFIYQVNMGKHYEADRNISLVFNDYNIKLENFKSELDKLFSVNMYEDDYAYIWSILLSGSKNFDFSLDYSALIKSSVIREKAEYIISAVTREFGIDIHGDELFLQGLYSCLDDALKRDKMHVPMVSYYLNEICQLYPKLFGVIKDAVIENGIFKNFSAINLDYEISYLTLHFQAAIERNRQNKRKLRAVIVNNRNPGITMLMDAKLSGRDAFEIVSIIQEDDLSDIQDVDFIITTVPIKNAKLPFVLISPFVLEEDELSIRDFLENTKL